MFLDSGAFLCYVLSLTIGREADTILIARVTYGKKFQNGRTKNRMGSHGKDMKPY